MINNKTYINKPYRFYIFKHIYTLCKMGSKDNQIKLIYLSILLFITGVSESLPILLVLPFITLISDPEKIWEIKKIKEISLANNINSPSELLFPFLLIFITSVLINGLLRIYSIKFRNNVKASVGHQLGRLAFKKILNSTYEFQITTTSSKILADFNDSLRMCRESLELFLDGSSSILTIVFIVSSLFFINKSLTLSLFIIIGIVYYSLGLLKNKKLENEGKIISKLSTDQTAIIQETLGAKKEIILNNEHSFYLEKFSKVNFKTEFSYSKIFTTITTTKYFVEAFFIIGIVSLAYVLKINYDTNPIAIMGSIALALQKLLPAGFSIFGSYTGLVSRYELSNRLLEIIKNTPQDIKAVKLLNKSKIEFLNLTLQNVSYSYPESNIKVIKNINLTINKGESLGIIGSTGSGKSTLIDMIMGFIKPIEGRVLINGINISNPKNIEQTISWRKSIAHVPQNIFLKDSTIIENIAFGFKLSEIDFDKAVYCAKISKIYDFINNTNNGFYSKVGERGINLSGGQIQRIAIARSLYKNSDVLIFDEATSALDSKTEVAVMESLKSHFKKLTIISIAHRTNTLIGYDRIVKINNGEIYEA